MEPRGVPPPPPLPMPSVPIPPPPPPMPGPENRTLTLSRSFSSTSTETETPPQTPKPTSLSRATGINSNSVDLMHAELRMLLSQQPGLKIPRTPEVFINQHSTVEEVKEWLKLKGFNDAVVNRLAGLAGNTLLALKKNDIQKLLEDCEGDTRDEIKRLDSQLKKQRATHPFHTSRTRELHAVLARARRKAEQMDDVAEENENRDRENGEEFQSTA